VKRSVHLLGPGSTAVIIGTGGLGQMAIQVLRALCTATTIVAVDTSADKLQIAEKMGADEGLLSGEEAVKRVKDITGGQGAELVLDLVAVDQTLAMSAQMARVLGHLLNEVGLPRVPQVLAQPVIVGNVFRADRPSQRARVLLGQTLDVKHLRTGQPVDLPRLRRGEQQGRDHPRHVLGGDRRGAPGAEGQSQHIALAHGSPGQHTVNSGLSNNTVGRTRTTGTPDQFMICSASQNSRCWRDSWLLVRVICETVICDMLTITSRPPSSRAAAQTIATSCR
jgi:hypothetical protein